MRAFVVRIFAWDDFNFFQTILVYRSTRALGISAISSVPLSILLCFFFYFPSHGELPMYIVRFREKNDTAQTVLAMSR